MSQSLAVLSPCDCRDSNRQGPLADPGIGGLHYPYCPAYAMTRDEEIEWRHRRLGGLA